MKNATTTTALILALGLTAGASFAADSSPRARLNSVQTSSYFAQSAPSVLSRAVVKAEVINTQQELAKHQERSDSYTAARMDELKLNTEAERVQMRSVIDQAKASGTKSPAEIKRAEDAYARMEILEKVLKGEKVEKILD